MFYMDENTLRDGRALITINKDKQSISKIVKSGTLNYTTSDQKLWVSVPYIREHATEPNVLDKLDKVALLKSGYIFDESFEFAEDQLFKKNVTVERDLLVRGNFKVLGSSTVIDTPTLSIEDNIIEINRNETGAGVSLLKAGLAINRGSEGFSRIAFNEISNSFTLDKCATIDGDSLFSPIEIFLEDGGDFKAGDMKLRNKLYSLDANIRKVLSVDDIILTDKITVSNIATINGLLTVNAVTTINGELGINGATTFNATANFLKPITIGDVSTFIKAATFRDKIVVHKTSQFMAGLTVDRSGANVSGDSVFNDNLLIKKNTTCMGNLRISGNGYVEGSVTSGDVIRGKNIITDNDITVKEGSGKGILFASNQGFKIFTDLTTSNGKFTSAATSDINMYFKMSEGTNRGFIFKSANVPVAQVESTGIFRTKDNIYSKDSLVLTEAMEGHGNGIDADTVDGKHSADILLRDGTQSMLGNLNVATNDIIWNSGNMLKYNDGIAGVGETLRGFKLIANNNIQKTAIESGLFKACDVYIDGARKTISNVNDYKSDKGSLILSDSKTIKINNNKAYDLVNIISARLRADSGIHIGNEGNVLNVDSNTFAYKGQNVLDTSGTKFMNGNMNFNNKKIRFSTGTLGLDNENSFSEIFTTFENGTILNLLIGKGNADKISMKQTLEDGTVKTILNANKDKVVFTDNPYHNENRLLSTADEGHGKGLDADTIDGKHFSDITNDFVNANGDTIRGDLFFELSNKAKFRSDTTFINKDVDTFNIKSESDISISSNGNSVVATRDGLLKINNDRVLTIGDEGHENELDADTVDSIHADQFVRRDIETTMTADLNFAGRKAKFNENLVYGQDNKMFIKTPKTSLEINDITKETKIIVENIDILTASSQSIKFKDNTVWHTGNLDPNLYEKIEPLEDTGTSIDTILNTGKYIINSVSGVNSFINSKPALLEVIRLNENIRLQRLSTFDGKYIVQRSIDRTTISKWIIIAGKESISKDIRLEEWKDGGTMFYIDIAHDLIYSGITSVSLCDTDGFSIFTGFKEINNSTIRIYSASKMTGKISISVSLN